MPFDPISWTVGFVLTKAAQKGIDVTFGPSLQRDLANEVKAWNDALPPDAQLIPEALFSPLTGAGKHDDGPALLRLREQFLSLSLPSEKDWFEALFERWKTVRDNQGDDAQLFFRLSESEAASHLTLLAQRLRRRCSQDVQVALPHIVESLDRIEVTLTEFLQMRSLRALHGQIDLDSAAIQRATNAARAIATRKGWRSCWEMHRSFSERLQVLLIFAEEDSSPVRGVFDVDGKQLTLWASLPDHYVESAIAGVMFGSPLFTGIEENWNSMVTFIGDTARALYPDSVRGGWFGISARYDLKRIGVPFPTSCMAEANGERVIRMKLGNDDSVPFLTFGPNQLQELIGPGQADAAGQVAEWLFRDWGTPTVLPSASK